MKNLKERWKRTAVMGLAAIMLTVQLPVSAFAEETVKQETSERPGVTQEMTTAPETPEQPEDKAAAGAPEQPEDKNESGRQEQPKHPEDGDAEEAVSGNNADSASENASTELPAEPVISEAEAEDRAGDRAPTDWVSDNSLPNESGSYKLTKDVTISETWVVSANITLDLSGNTITMTDNKDVIKVQSGSALTITDSSDGAGGITHGESCTGRGVYVGNDGSFTMEGGSIYGNSVSEDHASGAGVYVGNGGRFTMNGGSIYGNSVSGNQASGGGVYVGNGGSFTMTVGSISGNTADVYEKRSNSKGGGVFVDEGGSFEMTGGSIYKNRVKGNGEDDVADGAGVYIYGDMDTENQGGSFIMNGGSIYGNTAKGLVKGAGVYVGYDSSFTMNDGSIYLNEMYGDTALCNQGNGGGVFVDGGGSFEMTGGSISYNTAASSDRDGNGGGVCIGEGGSFEMTGGSIYGNKTGDRGNGGGVCVGFRSNFTVSGDAKIRNNHANEGNGGGVYVDGGSLSMNGGSIYGNEADQEGNGGGVYIKEGSFEMSAGSIYGNIAKYNYNRESGDGGGVYIEGGSFTLTGGSISGNNSYCDGGGVYVKDYVINKNNKYDGIFTMTGGSISGNTSAGGGGVYVDEQGSFTLTGGSISGNKAGYLTVRCPGGGVYVGGGSSFTMSGDAVIRENTAVNGGGVYVNNLGRFTMTGGSIIGNEAAFEAYLGDGGGVYIGEVQFGNPGIFIMTGGSISGNSATNKGGGVIVNPSNSFTMSGNGVIKDNTAGEYGGGVAVEKKTSFTLSGTAEISGNTLSANNTANNVWLNKGEFITVNGELKGTGKVGIMSLFAPCTVVRGDGHTLSENALEYFFSDDTAYLLDLDRESNEIKLVSPCSHENRKLVPGTAKQPTCMAEGYEGDYECLNCGIIISGNSIPVDPNAHDYDYTKGEVKTPATHYTWGETIYTCRHNPQHKITLKDIEPLPYEDKRDTNDFIEDTKDLSGDSAPKGVVSENETERTESISISGEEISKTVTDKESGKETVESKVWITGLQSTYTYTGSAIKPGFHVYDGTKLLKEKTDYTVSFKNNKDAGKAEITLKFKGSYKDTKPETVNFEIKPAVLGVDIIAHETGVAAKKGAQKPVPMLTWAATGKTVSSKDFSYDPSTVEKNEDYDYTATITPKKEGGNFAGSTTALIKVRNKDKVLSNVKVTFDKKTYEYTGKPIELKYTLKMGSTELKENVDYRRVSITGNTNPGSATVIFEALSKNSAGYVGSKTATFKISGKIELKDAEPFKYSYEESVPFAKGGAKPVVTVNYDGTVLREGIDYTVMYTKNKAVTSGATAELKIKGKGNYKGTVPKKFAIRQQSFLALSENIIVADQFTTKSNVKKPSVTITDLDGKKLKADTDYTVGDPDVSVSGNTDTKGAAKVVIKGKGAYLEEEVTVTFRYEDKAFDLAKAKAVKKIDDQTFTGNAVKLSNADLKGVLKTKDKNGADVELIPGRDFTVKGYSNNIKTGTAKVTLKGTGTFAGTKTVTFKIVKKQIDYKGRLF